ncbi:MAG: serine/threonine protein kinase, partial [Lachnospiraceae bacterium]|nr:serine/threonine protein kinase [Lachnospiraceae bacterium]
MSNEYPLALPEGTILNGKYIIKRVLGQGGFGITYEASVHKSNEIVAIKEYLPDTMASRSTNTTVSAFSGERGANFEYGKQCFLEEAKTLANFIGNPGIVEVKKYFEENGTAYFVMEFVKGKSYKDYLEDKGGKIPIDEALKILTPVMDALSAVHSRGIIHRDVTPDNICITDDGKVKLLDFGAARYSLGDKSRSLDVVLKHGYAPKEQYTRHGRQGPYTDVYAFAVTIYRSITGRLIQDSIDRLEEDSLILPSALGVKISERQENALLKALAVDSRDRYQSMAEFKAALLGEENAAAAPVVGGSNEIVFTAPKNDHTELQQQTAVSSQASINSSQKTGTDILKPTVQDNKTVNDPQDANVQGQTNSTATKKNKLLLVAAAVVGALVIIGGIVALVPKGNSNVQGEIVEEAKVDSTEASEQGAKEENTVKEGELKAEGSDDANSDIKTFDSQGSMDGRIQADVGSKDNTYKLEN